MTAPVSAPVSPASASYFGSIKTSHWYGRSIAVLKPLDCACVAIALTASIVIAIAVVNAVGIAILPLAVCGIAITALGSYYFLRYRIHSHFRCVAAEQTHKIAELVSKMGNDFKLGAEIQEELNKMKGDTFEFLSSILSDVPRKIEEFSKDAINPNFLSYFDDKKKTLLTFLAGIQSQLTYKTVQPISIKIPEEESEVGDQMDAFGD